MSIVRFYWTCSACYGGLLFLGYPHREILGFVGAGGEIISLHPVCMGKSRDRPMALPVTMTVFRGRGLEPGAVSCLIVIKTIVQPGCRASVWGVGKEDCSGDFLSHRKSAGKAEGWAAGNSKSERDCPLEWNSQSIPCALSCQKWPAMQ